MQKSKKRIIARRAKQAKKLFLASVQNKRTDHWKLCLASYYVVGLRDGSTDALARESDGVSVDSIEDYARTYRLYNAIRRRYDRLRCIARGTAHMEAADRVYYQVVRDLRDLRKVLHYTKWLIVANAVFTGYKVRGGRKRLTLPQALDALKSGADGSTEMFAAYVAGSEISRQKAFRKAKKALESVLSYPLPHRKKQVFKKAYQMSLQELSNDNR